MTSASEISSSIEYLIKLLFASIELFYLFLTGILPKRWSVRFFSISKFEFSKRVRIRKSVYRRSSRWLNNLICTSMMITKILKNRAELWTLLTFLLQKNPKLCARRFWACFPRVSNSIRKLFYFVVEAFFANEANSDLSQKWICSFWVKFVSDLSLASSWLVKRSSE